MIKELSKKNIIDKNGVFVEVCPGDDIYEIEWMLIEKYNCYYWNSGDYHNCSEHHIGDTEDHSVYFQISYNWQRNIISMREVVVLGKNNKVSVTSQMINREKKLKKLIKKCSRKVI